MSELTDEAVEAACEAMHDAYEDAAVRHGWATQERSRKPWSEVPEANKATMRDAVRAAAPLIAARVLNHAADDWQGGEWADAPRRADRAQERIANGQYVGDWLRARAAKAAP